MNILEITDAIIQTPTLDEYRARNERAKKFLEECTHEDVVEVQDGPHGNKKVCKDCGLENK